MGSFGLFAGTSEALTRIALIFNDELLCRSVQTPFPTSTFTAPLTSKSRSMATKPPQWRDSRSDSAAMVKLGRAFAQCRLPAGGAPSVPMATMIRGHVSAPAVSPFWRATRPSPSLRCEVVVRTDLMHRLVILGTYVFDKRRRVPRPGFDLQKAVIVPEERLHPCKGCEFVAFYVDL
jgi:hypothetical protein